MKLVNSTNDFQEGLYSTFEDLDLEKKSKFANWQGCCNFDITKIEKVYTDFKVNLKDTYFLISGVLEEIEANSSKLNLKEE